MPGKLRNLKAIKANATEITEFGSKLFDLISKEGELKESREKAIAFLENISRGSENGDEQEYIEKLLKFNKVCDKSDSSAEGKYFGNAKIYCEFGKRREILG